MPCFFKNGHYLFLPLRFISSYDSKFSIKQTLDKLEQLSSVSLDETRVQYILDAVDSARKAFPRQPSNKKKSVQQERISHRKDTGQHCTENDVSDQNGLVEERVSTIIKTLIINSYSSRTRRLRADIYNQRGLRPRWLLPAHIRQVREE